MKQSIWGAWSARRLAVMLTAAVVAGSAVATAPVRAVDTEAPDAVVVWNQHATTALITTAGQAPHVAWIHLAMVQAAVYDAVNAIDGRHTPYLAQPPASVGFSRSAAAATAAHDVLVTLVPALTATLDGHYADSLAAIPDGTAKTGGIQVGAAAAAAMLAARADDGRFGTPGFPVGSQPGEWRPVPPAFANDPAAWVADVRPFVVRGASRYLSDGPDELTGTAYAADFAEVKALGSLGSSRRTAEQTDIALFWNDHVPALWSRILRQISATAGLSIADNARLYAMVNLTAADAVIASWYDKTYHSSWRPITAIREAHTDGNPSTVADADWLPLVTTPPFPEHSSAHAAVSGGIVRTLQQFFRSDRMEFSAHSNSSGTTRSFTRFSQAIAEVVDARVWSGIHFRRADEQGRKMGYEIAMFRHRKFFKPIR